MFWLGLLVGVVLIMLALGLFAFFDDDVYIAPTRGERQIPAATAICFTCKHVIEASSASTITEIFSGGSLYGGNNSYQKTYCQEHRPSYDEVHIISYPRSYPNKPTTKTFYRLRVQVDEMGTPIDYIKEKS
jgi:hypothetical protein